MAPFVHVAWASAEFTAIESATQSADFFDSDWRFGWDFDVGASALTVTALRVYSRELHTQRVIIHRVSDGVAMATADIAGVVGDWSEEAITPVALAAGTRYSVTVRMPTGATEHARNPTSVTYASQLTYVQARSGYAGTGDGMPTSTTTAVVYAHADFRFTV